MRISSVAVLLALSVGGAPRALAETPPASSHAGAKSADTKAPPPPQKKKKDESLDDLVGGQPPGDAPQQAQPQQQAPPQVAAPADNPASRSPTGTQPAPTAAPAPTGTDDNDNTAAAPPPAALEPVRPSQSPRRPGPYELTKLDCRVLDGAGVERILPQRVVAGEEPDLLCRVMVTQPATVAAADHQLTLTVHVNGKGTYQQTRQVRMSAVGRRAILFVVPADKIASSETATVVVRVTMTQPANPALREARFKVESED